MQAKKLRQLLNQKGIIMAVGAHDVWSARLIEMAGFPAVFMTGYGASASLLGQPDIGLLSMSEMADQARRMAAAIDIPILADADTGYGGVLNVVRTVREYENAGIAAIQMEDQVIPKRCGHMEGKQVIPKEEMVSKIRAAVYARKSEDFSIIARTDARAINGLDDALERAQAYADAGADIIFIEAPQSIDEMKKIGQVIKKPLMANMVEGGKTPFLTGKELEDMGYKISHYPDSTIFTMTKAIRDMLAAFSKADTTLVYEQNMTTFTEFNELVGLSKVRKLEKTFSKEC
jgi:carboxyvinyl-carboxyphosphonate phosphorylmutase